MTRMGLQKLPPHSHPRQTKQPNPSTFMVSAALQPINKNGRGGVPAARNRNEACSSVKAVSSAVRPRRAKGLSVCSALNGCPPGQADASPPCRYEGPLEPLSRALQFPHLLKALAFILALLPSDTFPSFSMANSATLRTSAPTAWCFKAAEERHLHHLITHNDH